jgi:HIRAN domain.
MLTQSTQAPIQQKQNLKVVEAKVHGRVITTNVVGVSFDDRQEVIARMQIGDRVWLERDPKNPFDSNAIRVNSNNGEQIGFLNARLAAKLFKLCDRYGLPIQGKVYLLTGSSYDSYLLGVVIAFRVPRTHEHQMRINFAWGDDECYK